MVTEWIPNNNVRARKSPRIETTVSATTAPFKSSGLVRARGLKQVTRVQNELKKASGLVRARGLKHPEIDALLAGLASGLVRARGLKLGAAVAELQVVRQGS